MNEATPLDTWRLRALLSASDLSLPLEEVNASAAIMVNAFGSKTLQRLSGRVDKSIAVPIRPNPIGRALTTPGAESVVSICEVANYLADFSETPTSREIVATLVSQYYSTLLQLAVAYRLKRVGASAVVLEPALPSGRRADIGCEFAGIPVIVECYRPTVVGRPEHHDSFLGKAILDGIGDWPQPVAVGVLVRRKLDATLRLRVTREVKRLLRAVREGSFVESRYHRDHECEISVAPTVMAAAGEQSLFATDPSFPSDLGEPRFFMRVGKMPRAEAEQLSPNLSYPTGSCVALWDPAADVDGRIDPRTALSRLLRKARKKMSQTKVSSSNLRLIILDTWITEHLDDLDDAATPVFSDELLRHHDGDIRALCLRRRWDPERQRFSYVYRSFGRESATVGHDVVKALELWESANTVPGSCP